MSDNYTLVIPTYNRSQLLAALLRFLTAEGADFPIIVLDSSSSEYRTRNKALLAASRLQLEYIEYDEATHPFDKFCDGVHRVRTPLSSMCADDDLVLVDSVRRCVRYLHEHQDVCVAHGYYFTFLDQGANGIDLTTMLYFTPSIEHDEPLWRLRKLLQSYQALTYGIYRTPVLQSVLDRMRQVQSFLARELLSGALSVIEGKVARLQCFYGGRSHNPPTQYSHWHPLEWLITNPREFCEEYGRYRDILLDALGQLPSNTFSPADTERIVDLIHAFYVIVHAPRESHDFILDQVMAGRDLQQFWADPAIQNPLVMAHYATQGALGAQATAHSRLRQWPRRVVERVLSYRSHSKPVIEPETTWPKVVSTPARMYRMHKNFLAFEPKELVLSNPEDIKALLASLDQYTIAGD